MALNEFQKQEAKALFAQGKSTMDVYRHFGARTGGFESPLDVEQRQSILSQPTFGQQRRTQLGQVITDIPNDIGSGIKQLGEGYLARYDRLKESGSALARGEQGVLETGVQFGANIAGGLLADTAFQGVKTLASLATTPEQETRIGQSVGEAVTNIGEKTGLTNWYTSLSPRSQRNVNAGLDILDVAPVGVAGKLKGLFNKPSVTPPVEQISREVMSAYNGESVSGTARMVNNSVDDVARTKLVTDLSKAYQDSVVGDLKVYNRRLQEQAQGMSRGGNVVTQDDLINNLASEGIVPDVRGKLADFSAELRRIDERQNKLFEQYRPILESTTATAPIEDFATYAKKSMSGSRALATELDKADVQLDRIITNLSRSFNVDETGKLTASQIDEISRIANDRTKAYRDTDVFQADVFSELGRAARLWLQQNVPDNSFRQVNDEWMRLQNIKTTAENLQNAQIDVGLLGRAIGSYVTTVGATALAAPSGNPAVALLAGMLTKMGGDEVANWMRGNKFSPEVRDILQRQVLEKDAQLLERLKQTATDTDNKNFFEQAQRGLPAPEPGSPRSQVSSGATVRASAQGDAAPTGQILETSRPGAIKQPSGEGQPLSRSLYPEITDAELQKLKTSEFRKLLEKVGVDADDVTKAIAGGTIGILLASYFGEDGEMLPAFGALMGIAASRGGKLKMLDEAIEANMKRRNVLSAAGKEDTSREMQIINKQYKTLVRERNKVADSLSPGLGTKDVTKEMSPDPTLRPNKDVPMKDVAGNKFTVKSGTVLTPEINAKGQAILNVDGKQYVVAKNQYDNLKGQSTRAVASPFAPELDGLDETVRGSQNFRDEARALMDDEAGEGLTFEEALDQVEMDAESAVAPKYSQYTLPGGEDYREVLLMAPESSNPNVKFISETDNQYVFEINGEKKTVGKGTVASKEEAIKYFEKGTIANKNPNTYKSSHWDEPNVIAHLRLNDRKWNGKKVTFMEELQSDMAREAREGKIDAKFGEISKNWPIKGTKRALLDAVDRDADVFAWINGAQTSERYKLSTQVEKVAWKKEYSTDDREINIIPQDGSQVIKVKINNKGTVVSSSKGAFKGKKLDEVLGKGMADSIMSKESGELAGEGLNFGGEWANNLYDRQVRDIVKKLTGAEVKSADMGLGDGVKKTRFIKQSGRDAGGALSKNDLKVGLEINMDAPDSNLTIVEVLGNGKFKAVETKLYNDANNTTINEVTLPSGNKGYEYISDDGRKIKTNKLEYAEKAIQDKKKGIAEATVEFDLNSKPSTQQYIELTPEVKAKIQSKAPNLSMKTQMATYGIPLLMLYFSQEEN